MLYPSFDNNIGSRSRVSESAGGGGFGAAATAAAGMATAAALSQAVPGPMSQLEKYLEWLLGKVGDLWNEYWQPYRAKAPYGWRYRDYLPNASCVGTSIRHCHSTAAPVGNCPYQGGLPCFSGAGQDYAAMAARTAYVWYYDKKSVTTGRVPAYYERIGAAGDYPAPHTHVRSRPLDMLPKAEPKEKEKPSVHYSPTRAWSVRPMRFYAIARPIPFNWLSLVAALEYAMDYPERSHRGNRERHPPADVVRPPRARVGTEAPSIPRTRPITGAIPRAPGKVVPRVIPVPGSVAVRVPSQVPERKVHVTQFGHPIGNIVGKATELLDLVDCLAEGLPEAVKRDLRRNGDWNTSGKTAAIAEWWSQMDLQKSLTECAKQNAIDFVGASFGKAVAGVGAGLGLPVGLGTLASVLGVKPKSLPLSGLFG